jgi:tetratricopeptide (TPR) repeat protein
MIGTTLVACGGGNTAETPPPRDIKLDQATNAGSQALSMDFPDVAVRQYKVALARAYERDDPAAISDVAYNLALALLRVGDPKGAVATVRAAQAELDRRHIPVAAELSLVQAAAAYRVGDFAGAVTAAQQALDRPASDPDTAPRAWFIRGLVAANQGDRAALAQAIAALRPSKSADLEADRLELQGRSALLDDRPAQALTAFDQSAANRQQSLDYRGMARTLASAGDASLRLDRAADAANYFLRAGRSALLQGDGTMALPLLKRAEDLARQSGQNSIVAEVVRLRGEAAARAPVAR